MAKITVLPGIVQQFDVATQTEVDALTAAIEQLQEQIDACCSGSGPTLPRIIGEIAGNGNGYVLLLGDHTDEYTTEGSIFGISDDGVSFVFEAQLARTVVATNPSGVLYTQFYFRGDPSNDVNGKELIQLTVA